MTTPGISSAIKSTIIRLGPHASPNRIVESLAEIGIDVTQSHVSRIKMQMVREDAKAEAHRTKKPVKDRRKKRPQQRKILGRRV